MKNKVYYGEYSLEHWIKLILKKNIVLPDYQRYYVWNQEKVRTLIESFNKHEFVPPVTIGAFMDGEEQKNLILDGQQRLTSIFLAYLSIFPNKECEDWAPKSFIPLADTNDDSENDDEFYKGLDWNFNKLISIGNTKKVIKQEVKIPEQYLEIDMEISEEFFKNNFLGFSFLVPSYDGEKNENDGEKIDNFKKNQIKFYSSVFRHINIQGEGLSNLESRRSLYFLNKDLEHFFDPKYFKSVKIKDKKLDFVRYLALLDAYEENEQNEYKVAVGKKRQDKLEQFFVDYVYKIVGDGNFIVSQKLSVLEKNLDFLKDLNVAFFTKNFQSIIDADVYLFGWIYFSIFQQKEINSKKCTDVNFESLQKELDLAIKDFKTDKEHQKSPSALKYLRNRLKTSINLYKEYFSE